MNKPPKQSNPTSEGLESHLGFWMRFVSNHVSAEFKRRVEENGVSVSEWVALRQMFDDPSATAATLQETLGMTKGAISKILTRLEQKNLLQRVYQSQDKRAQHLSLTPAGKRLVPRLTRIADDNDAHFFGHLAATERAALAQLLKDIVHRHHLKSVPVE